MILTVHRGTRQIGGSCLELQSTQGARILLDLGMPLTQPDGLSWPRGASTWPSRDLREEGVLPEIEGLYSDSVPAFSAVILSHAHLDHHGLAHHVHPDIPVYGSRGTLSLLRASRLFVVDTVLPSDLRELPDSGSLVVGPFSIRGIPVDHAAPDSRALLVEADEQRVLYSGDLRAHGRRGHLVDELAVAAGPIDVLVLEGTTVGQVSGSHGFATEEEVEKRLVEILKGADHMVVVIASGQNIDRAVSVHRAATTTGRELVIDPYQAYILRELRDLLPEAPQFDSPSVRVKFIRHHVERLKEAGHWDLACQMSRAAKVTAEQMKTDPGRFVYLARSSGATVALLRNLHKSTELTVVWSQWKGYLEKGGPVVEFCKRHGLDIAVVHSGGHASPGDLRRLAARLRPGAVVPIHTEAAAGFSDLMKHVRVMVDGVAVEVAALVDGR